MTIILPQGDNLLSQPSHSFLHRVITVDTDSFESSIHVDGGGCVGIGTVSPIDKLEIFGEDDADLGEWYSQTNGVTLDSSLDIDRYLAWSRGKSIKWSLGPFRNEEERFMYLSADSTEEVPFMLSEGGRCGLNKQSNYLNYHTSKTVGTGINDLNISGIYELNYLTIYRIRVKTQNGNGTPDVMEFCKSIDDGSTFGSYSAFNATLDPSNFDSNVAASFDVINGHTVGDVWEFGAFPQLPLATFSVAPPMITEALLSSDYSVGSPEGAPFEDITGNINTSTIEGANVNCFELGANKNALYLGFPSGQTEIHFSFEQFGAGVVLVTEYYDGVTWNEIMPNMGYVDGTNNFSQNGPIRMEHEAMTGWGLTNPVNPGKDSYELYWIRMRHTGVITQTPIINFVSRHGDNRVSVFAAANDFLPSFYIGAGGGVHSKQKITAEKGFVLLSPDGTEWKIKVSDAGALSAELN